MAQQLLAKHAFTYDGVHPVVGKPPGFPALIAGYLAVFDSIQGFQLVLLLSMLASFLIIVRAAEEISGGRWATGLFAFLVALFPLNLLVTNLLSEPGFLLLSSIGLYLLLTFRNDQGYGRAIAAGAAFAGATYFRPITLFWPFFLLLLAGIFFRKEMRRAVAITAVHLILVAPWIYRNWSEFKAFVPMVANWAPLYYITEPDLWRTYFIKGSAVIRGQPEHEAILDGEFEFNWAPSQRFKELALTNIKREPLQYIGSCSRQALFVWTYLPGTKMWYESRPVLFALGRLAMILFYLVTLLGAIVSWKSRKRTVVILASYMLYTALMLFPVCTESRYLVPVYLWLLPLTLAGAAFLASEARSRWGGTLVAISTR